MVALYNFTHLLLPSIETLDNVKFYLINNHSLSSAESSMNAIEDWYDIIFHIFGSLTVGALAMGLCAMLDSATIRDNGTMPIHQNKKVKQQLNPTAKNISRFINLKQYVMIISAFSSSIACNPWLADVSIPLFFDAMLYSLAATGCIICAQRKFMQNLLANTTQNNTSPYKERFLTPRMYYNKHNLYAIDNICYVTKNTSGLRYNEETRIGILENNQISLLENAIEDDETKDVTVTFRRGDKTIHRWKTLLRDTSIHNMLHRLNAELSAVFLTNEPINFTIHTHDENENENENEVLASGCISSAQIIAHKQTL
jgi:hypothetical protein